MNYEFINTEFNSQKLNLYSALLSLVFPDTKKYTPKFLNWQYNLNPNGKVLGYDAFLNNELAGHYVTIPVQYIFNGVLLKGLLSLNTAIHPHHQGKGLFTQLAQKTYAHASELGYEFVIGVANQNSTPGFLNKLQFKLISPLAVEVFMGKPQLKPVPENFMKSVWDIESAKWRLKNPAAGYIKNNLCITTKTHISLIHAVMSVRKEIFSDGLDEHTSFLKMTIGLNNKNKFKINLPSVLKPSPLNLIFKPLNNFKAEINSSNLFFELIDFDAY